MPYEMVENFAAGLDTRKSPLTAPGGTLVRLKNAAINPGGEIEKRRAFVKVATLTGTFGLAATESTLYAFTRNTNLTPPVITVPTATLAYQKIPNAAADLDQADYDTFDGLIYLVGTQPSGTTDILKNPHYYNAVLTTSGSGKGYYVRTFQSKMYGINKKYLYFSAVGDPMNWDAGTGHGYINLSLQDADSELLTALEVYYDKLAVLSSEAVQLWAVDPDPAQNSYLQLLRGVGTMAPRATLQFGNGDVLFLDRSGVRSMKARDASNSASVSDIGSPIDNLMTDLRLTKGGSTYYNKAVSLLEPLVGRFWVVFPDEIYVLSYFPGPKITAWSYYTMPFTVQHAVTCGGRIFLRSGDDLYVYGGDDNKAYDNCGVEVRLPYLNAKKPGHRKLFEALDMTIQGTWEARVSYDYGNPDAEESLGVFTKPTWRDGRAELTGFESHASFRFYNTDANFASLSNVAIHYQMMEDTD